MFGAATHPLDSAIYQYLLDHEVRRAVRYSHFFSICHVGLDQSANGDRDLVYTVSDILRQIIRETDVVGLLTGQTFSVLLHNTEIQNASQVGERLKNRIAEQTFRLENMPIQLTASIGGVCFPTHGNDAATLLVRADEMLALAKAQGGNQVLIPDP